jgi:SAM-dependent methyltransferase
LKAGRAAMDFAELSALASGHAEARAIQTALKLGIFDVLESRPLDDAALAAAISANRRATALIANAMVSLELLDKNAGHYSLTATSQRYLLRSSPEYLGGLILFDEAIFGTWTLLEQAVRTGAAARPTDMFQSRPEETERFIRAMDSLTRARGDPIYVADRLDLSRVSKLADIGGGPGTYAVAMLHRWPHLRAAIYDLPATLEVARRILAEREPAALDRIDLVRVDYLYDEIPGPCGALFMSNIIHNEDETDNAQLLRKCFRALEPGGLMIIKDHIMNADLTEPRPGAIFALYLLLTTRGRDYSFDEVSRWLGDAGFVDTRLETLPSPQFTSSMVIARKP